MTQVMPGARDMVVVGASAGGVEALTKLVRSLPRGYTGTLFVVLHIAPEGTSVLAPILERAGVMPAETPKDGDVPKPGCLYVAPPNFHLLLDDRGRIALSAGPKENGHRPAVDPLFRSAAAVYGRRAVGVVMSGSRDDGTAGLQAIKAAGGVAIVQDPSEALAPSMPLGAIEHVAVDAVRPAEEIAALLVRLASVEPGLVPSGNGAAGGEDAAEATDAREPAVMRSTSPITPGNSSGLTCPECSGALWEVKEQNLIQYRCRVGHVYSLESMLAEQARSVEAALWAGVAALEERAQLMRRVANRAGGGQFSRLTDRFNDEAEHADHQARLLRDAVTEYASTDLSTLSGAGDQGD
jgi:two-component system, chemotaxis family, protein-glutamate methylesterase/glutaminase